VQALKSNTDQIEQNYTVARAHLQLNIAGSVAIFENLYFRTERNPEQDDGGVHL
jgi:hypothetical protein